MQRAQGGEPHLAGDRLNHAIGRQPRPDDRVDTGWQRIRRWKARELRWKHLRAAATTTTTTTTTTTPTTAAPSPTTPASTATAATAATAPPAATTTAATRWHHEG